MGEGTGSPGPSPCYGTALAAAMTKIELTVFNFQTVCAKAPERRARLYRFSVLPEFIELDITADQTEGKPVAVYDTIISSCRQWSFVVSLSYLCVLDASKPRDKACFTTR